MKNKGKISNRLLKLSEDNQKWFKNYLNWLPQNGVTTKNSIEEYRSTAINIMELLPESDVNNLTLEQIIFFLSDNEKPNTYNKKVNFTKKFFIFLKESEQLELQFPIEGIDKLLKKYNAKEIKSQTDTAKPLQFKEISKIREALKVYPAGLFFFEMTLRYGVTFKQWPDLNEDNYDIETKTFKSLNIVVEQDIHELIIANPKILKRKSFQGILTYYSKKLEINFSYYDIIATRKEYFLKCFFCNKIFENTSKNWVLVQFPNDDKKWIVCRNCGTRGLVNG